MVLISISSQKTQETTEREIEEKEKGYESPTTGSMSPLVRELRHFY